MNLGILLFYLFYLIDYLHIIYWSVLVRVVSSIVYMNYIYILYYCIFTPGCKCCIRFTLMGLILVKFAKLSPREKFEEVRFAKISIREKLKTVNSQI